MVEQCQNLDIIHTAWNFTLSGSPSYVWESKLSVVRSSMKKWAATSYSEPTIAKKSLQSRRDTLHSKMEAEEITPETLAKEKTLNCEILIAAKQEKETLRIKSR